MPTASGGASQVDVTSLLQASRCLVIFPDEVERPAAGVHTYFVETFIYDAEGNMETPDAIPTIEIRTVAGGVIQATTPMTLVSAGRYRYTYTLAAGDALGVLVIIVSVTEGGMTRTYGKIFEIVSEVDMLNDINDKCDAFQDIEGAGFVSATDSLAALEPVVAKEATLTNRPTLAQIEAGDVGDIKTAIDKQTGADADTQTGALNIGAGELSIFTITKSTRYKIHGAFASIVNCQAGATITVRVYLVINSVERKIAEETYVKGTDPDGIIVVSGTMGATGNFRVSMQSDNAGDNAVVVPYQYVTEDME